jgi:hypothetical protein
MECGWTTLNPKPISGFCVLKIWKFGNKKFWQNALCSNFPCHRKSSLLEICALGSLWLLNLLKDPTVGYMIDLPILEEADCTKKLDDVASWVEANLMNTHKSPCSNNYYEPIFKAFINLKLHSTQIKFQLSSTLCPSISATTIICYLLTTQNGFDAQTLLLLWYTVC